MQVAAIAGMQKIVSVCTLMASLVIFYYILKR
jgi:hypothetical protein